MKILNEHKPYLNQLITYYRRNLSKNDESFLSKNFIYDNKGFPICTLSTLSRLENNKTQCFDKIYYSLLDNLDMVYNNNPRINKLITDINLSILKYAEYNDRKKLTELLKKTTHILSSYNHNIIYQEYYELYEMLLQFYEDFAFDKDKIDKAITLFSMIDPVLQALVIDVAYQYYTKIHIDHYHSLDIVKLVDYLTIDCTIKEYYILTKHFREYNISEIKKISEALIKKLEKSRNNYFLCKVYNIYAFLLTDSNPEKAIYFLKQAVDLFNEAFDFNNNLCTYLRNLGTASFLNKEYSLSSNSFYTVIDIDQNLLVLIFPYFIYSLYKSNTTPEEIIIILKKLQNMENHIEQGFFYHIYTLFKIKYKLAPYKEFGCAIKNLIKIDNMLREMNSLKIIITDIIYEISSEHLDFTLYNNYVKLSSK